MSRLVNPFFFESPSDRWAFTDRETLVPRLTELMQQRGRRLLLHGRRRMGKTSLLKNAALKAGATLLFVDISTAAGLNEVAKKLLAEAPVREGRGFTRALELAKKHLKSFSVSAHKLVLSGELRLEEGEQTLEQVLNYLNASAETADQMWTVAFDEFQDIRDMGGPKVDWKLRGIIQEHRHLNYLFTGSDHRLVAWMTDPSAPFFKQLQQMEVGAIDGAHLAAWIERRAKTGGLPRFPYGELIVAQAGPCTGDVVRLAKAVFDLAAGGREGNLVPVAFDAIALVELNGEFNASWRSLSPTQKPVLRALAAGRPPTASETLREYGLKAASTAQKAVEGLIERQFLVREGGRVVFDSPFFRRWVDFNGA